MKKIEFDKMHGLGNDYVYLTCMDNVPEHLSELAVAISDRHFGVGGDGLVVITRSDIADFRMIMFNNDGSEAQMCGNASRCIGRLVYEKGLTDKHEFTLETKAGIKEIRLNFEDGKLKDVSVNMGKPITDGRLVPVVAGETEDGLTVHNLVIDGRPMKVHAVGMGNPHGVIFEEVDEEFFMKNGRVLEHHEIWPEKANIEFIKVVGPHEIEMRVWERGTGETLACGTGACASAVASMLTGRTQNDVKVKMRGGELKISLNEKGEVIMTGEAVHVAKGEYYWEN